MRATKKYVVTIARGHLQPQRSHKRVASLLGKYRISDGRRGGDKGEVGRRNSSSLDEMQQRKLIFRVCILRDCATAASESPSCGVTLASAAVQLRLPCTDTSPVGMNTDRNHPMP
ncbi:hypothetical protein EVAR_83381_1 [Eumeta japonica]|uniref:Uncharacterized protein n=1 Tax=Eumeta variegata TaxID=151549 RepID=A0A4C1TYE0_EUMVA|nr:hypothetical protein EVAR_83381_1 [Eumeta japonica]